VRRREFIALVAGVAPWPLPARAQQSTMPVIGFLESDRLSRLKTVYVNFGEASNRPAISKAIM
jgi:hypothetical protein